MVKKGLFITFEGADGCGKSTQIAMTYKYLTDKGVIILDDSERVQFSKGIEHLIIEDFKRIDFWGIR